MYFKYWNPNKFDQDFENLAVERLVECGEVVAEKTRKNLKAIIGTGKKTGFSRPVYKTGKYAGAKWTSREAGRLMKSIRVTQKKSKHGKLLWRKRNIRVYIGHFTAYYGLILEFKTPYLRSAFYNSQPEMKSILGVR
jgi:hypothetical protein